VLLGTILGEQGDRAGARACYEESLVLSERLGNSQRLSNVLGSLAVLHGSEGEFDVAEALFARSLALSRKQGNPNNVAANLCNLAIVSSRRGMVDHARAYLAEALTIADQVGSRALGLAILGIAPVVAATAGEWERAARHHGASQAERSRQGFEANRDDDILAPLLLRAQDALGAQRFAAAAEAGRHLGFEQVMAEVRAWLSTSP
jgi:tetratricopeptide (TPR) repeat protein